MQTGKFRNQLILSVKSVNSLRLIYIFDATKLMDVLIKKDGKGYIAEVKGKNALYAFGYTKEEALQELQHVVDMMVDFYAEEIHFQKKLKKYLMNNILKYAV